MSCVPQLLFSRPDGRGEIITVEKRPVTALYDKRAKYLRSFYSTVDVCMVLIITYSTAQK